MLGEDVLVRIHDMRAETSLQKYDIFAKWAK